MFTPQCSMDLNLSSRKAWLKITTLVILFPFSLLKKEGGRKGEWIPKIVFLNLGLKSFEIRALVLLVKLVCRVKSWSSRKANHSLFLLPSFFGGKRKGKKNNQSRGQKSYLSARSKSLSFLEVERRCWKRLKSNWHLDAADVKCLLNIDSYKFQLWITMGMMNMASINVYFVFVYTFISLIFILYLFVKV